MSYLKIKYPDGTLIKYGTEHFLVFSGTKHLIDSGTMQIFSLKPNEAKVVSDSEFLSILTGDPLKA
ncbi:MAG: hypothetical protein AB1630_11865, partial [bacterium]